LFFSFLVLFIYDFLISGSSSCALFSFQVKTYIVNFLELGIFIYKIICKKNIISQSKIFLFFSIIYQYYCSFYYIFENFSLKYDLNDYWELFLTKYWIDENVQVEKSQC
jgi:hypothetical protein